MCRGCALPYAGTWDHDAPPDRDALALAVGRFAAALRPGGRLYVDTAAEPPSADPQVTRHPTIVVGEHRIDLTEELSLDRQRRLRLWHSRLEIDGRVHEFSRHSALPAARRPGRPDRRHRTHAGAASSDAGRALRGRHRSPPGRMSAPGAGGHRALCPQLLPRLLHQRRSGQRRSSSGAGGGHAGQDQQGAGRSWPG